MEKTSYCRNIILSNKKPIISNKNCTRVKTTFFCIPYPSLHPCFYTPTSYTSACPCVRTASSCDTGIAQRRSFSHLLKFLWLFSSVFRVFRRFFDIPYFSFVFSSLWEYPVLFLCFFLLYFCFPLLVIIRFSFPFAL